MTFRSINSLAYLLLGKTPRSKFGIMIHLSFVTVISTLPSPLVLSALQLTSIFYLLPATLLQSLFRKAFI